MRYLIIWIEYQGCWKYFFYWLFCYWLFCYQFFFQNFLVSVDDTMLRDIWWVSSVVSAFGFLPWCYYWFCLWWYCCWFFMLASWFFCFAGEEGFHLLIHFLMKYLYCCWWSQWHYCQFCGSVRGLKFLGFFFFLFQPIRLWDKAMVFQFAMIYTGFLTSSVDWTAFGSSSIGYFSQVDCR